MSPHQTTLESHAQQPQQLPRTLTRRLAFLKPTDRALIEMILLRQLTRTQVARLLDCPVGTITRRLQRLGTRLHDPIVADLLDEDCQLSPRTRQIAIEYFLHGRSIADLVRRHGPGRVTIARTLDFVRGWHQRRRTR